MLYLIGTGLYYLNDLPVRSLDELRKCDEIFLENYTNLSDTGFLKDLEKIIGRRISIVGRDSVESEEIVRKAAGGVVALLVPGDPLAATTHFSLVQECRKKEIGVKIIHASSIFSAIGETGLSLYKFGGTTSVPIYSENFHPESFFDVIEKNVSCDYHTLVLLEVRDKNDFVSPANAAKLIKEIERRRGKEIIAWKNVIVVSRLGSDRQRIVLAGEKDFEDLAPPCALIIPGRLNENEAEAMELLRTKN